MIARRIAKPPILVRAAIRRVLIENYRSIGRADVAFHDLTFLVGPNGTGKSNLLDALRFVSEAMSAPLDQVLRDRGGIDEVRRKTGGHPTHFGLRIEFSLGDGTVGFYALKIGARKPKGFVIARETCEVIGGPDLRDHFDVHAGTVKSSSQPAVAVSADRPYLVAASGNPAFRAVFDLLSRIQIYNINPTVIRDMQPTDAGDILKRDGSNLAAVLRRLTRDHKDRKACIDGFMSQIVSGIASIEAKPVQNRERIEFRQNMPGAKSSWRFPASSMSDGTLRALGVLTAIFQLPPPDSMDLPIVGIEEPEIAVHPHALGVLLEALLEASGHRQTVVTSHSPELLNRPEIDGDNLLAVSQQDGATVVAAVDEAGRAAIRERLCTAGELLRQNRLGPDTMAVARVAAIRQLKIFEHLPQP